MVWSSDLFGEVLCKQIDVEVNSEPYIWLLHKHKTQNYYYLANQFRYLTSDLDFFCPIQLMPTFLN